MNPTDLAQLYAIAVAGVAGVAIPGVVDLVTKSHLANGVKAAFAVLASALAGAITTVTITPAVHWQTLVLAVLSSFVAAMSSHATGYSGPIQDATKGFGVGPANPASADPVSSTESDEPEGPGVVGSGGYTLLETIVILLVVVVLVVVLLRVAT